MTITPNDELEVLIMGRVRECMAKKPQRDEANIHASDLKELRQAYWQRVAPRPATPAEIGFWLAGLGHHYYMVYSMYGIDDTQEESLFDEELGILYSPDLNSDRGEFKTSRYWQVPNGPLEAADAFRFYERQCRIYAVTAKINYWNLVVLFLFPPNAYNQKQPVLKAYTYNFTDQELEDERQQIKMDVSALKIALAKKDHLALPLCSEGICFKMIGQGRGRPKKMVPMCKFWEDCQPEGRYVNESS